jgi:hypothetical protein
MRRGFHGSRAVRSWKIDRQQPNDGCAGLDLLRLFLPFTTDAGKKTNDGGGSWTTPGPDAVSLEAREYKYGTIASTGCAAHPR